MLLSTLLLVNSATAFSQSRGKICSILDPNAEIWPVSRMPIKIRVDWDTAQEHVRRAFEEASRTWSQVSDSLRFDCCHYGTDATTTVTQTIYVNPYNWEDFFQSTFRMPYSGDVGALGVTKHSARRADYVFTVLRKHLVNWYANGVLVSRGTDLDRRENNPAADLYLVATHELGHWLALRDVKEYEHIKSIMFWAHPPTTDWSMPSTGLSHALSPADSMCVRCLFDKEDGCPAYQANRP